MNQGEITQAEIGQLPGLSRLEAIPEQEKEGHRGQKGHQSGSQDEDDVFSGEKPRPPFRLKDTGQ
jgi:hypothetical protein